MSQIDLFPTVCELLGIPRPHWLQGVSLLPLVHGATAVREEVFAEGTYHAAYEPQRAIRTERWKYIRRFDDRETPVRPNTDDGPGKDLWMRHGWAELPVEMERLHDLVFDPNEARNVVHDPELGEVAADLRERLEEWMRDTDDPLLDGPVPPPPGAEYNEQDQTSAREATTGRADAGPAARRR